MELDRLHHLLAYDSENGEFTRRIGVKGYAAGTNAGTLHKTSGYVYVGVDRKSYRAHRLAWFYMTGRWPVEIDHVNGDRSDNRWSNLRECSRAQNNANGKLRSDNSSGAKGVNWVARVGLWRAYVSVEKRQRHLGYFRNFDDAINARRIAAEQCFGEFAR